MAQTLLFDLKNFEEYVRLAQEMTNSMKGYETEQYKEWAEDIKYQIETENNPLALNMGGKFMEIGTKTEGMVEVNYSERLAILIREVRQLKELEFKIPKDIDKLAEDAKKFYKQAVTLKQIADFYNNMGEQIIHSQRPMMIKLALEFERTMNSSELKEGTTWQNTLELERYIARVKAAAESLMNENRRLKRIHEMVGDMVAGLFSTDLVKNRQKWKDSIERIRSTIETICKGRDRAEVTGWLLHWDHQLYKVLQYHYITGLHTLSDIMPSFNVDIVYNDKQIAFKPPLEELKGKYYKEIKNFIAIPAHFTGVGGSTAVFKPILDANANSLQVVYVKAEVRVGSNGVGVV
jgi:dynein heavy chain 2